MKEALPRRYRLQPLDDPRPVDVGKLPGIADERPVDLLLATWSQSRRSMELP